MPVIVLGSVLSVVLSTVAIPAWFAGVIFGRNTAGLQELGTFCLRYQLEVQAYVMLRDSGLPATRAARGHDDRARMISSCSGNRPSRCFEKISFPSATTSY